MFHLKSFSSNISCLSLISLQFHSTCKIPSLFFFIYIPLYPACIFAFPSCFPPHTFLLSFSPIPLSTLFFPLDVESCLTQLVNRAELLWGKNAFESKWNRLCSPVWTCMRIDESILSYHIIVRSVGQRGSWINKRGRNEGETGYFQWTRVGGREKATLLRWVVHVTGIKKKITARDGLSIK